MNNNDILEMLNRVVCHTTSEYEQKQRVIEEAKSLVERDEPKKLKVDSYLFESWECPSCGYVLFKKQRFCDHCGQRLDWRGEQDE